MAPNAQDQRGRHRHRYAADVYVGMEHHNERDRGEQQRNPMSTVGSTWQRPNIAKVMPSVLTSTSIMSAICSQPGFTTMFGRVKIANVISVIGAQILSASYMVLRKDALAIRAETAAVSEVGGDSSPHTDSRNTKKCAIQGSMPSAASAARSRPRR